MRNQFTLLTVLVLALFVISTGTICYLYLEIESLTEQLDKGPTVIIPDDYKSISQDTPIYGWHHNDTLFITYDNIDYYQDIR